MRGSSETSGGPKSEPLLDRVSRVTWDESTCDQRRSAPLLGTRSTIQRDSGADSDRASLREHGCSWQTFVWDSFSMMFGGTQLGYALGQMGLWWGIVWLGFSAWSTWVSGHLIGELVQATGASSYPELGEAAFGRSGRHFTVACQWAGYYLSGIVQIAYVGATWDQAVGKAADSVCQWEWMLITTVILLPLMQVPAFSQFSSLALASTIATLFMTAVYLGEIVAYGRYTHVCYDKWTTTTMLTNICNMAFTFSGHGSFPEQIRELKEPSEFKKAFDVLYALAMPFYVACALLAYWAFGNTNAANMYENLDSNVWVRIGLYLSLAAIMPVIVLGQVVLLLQVELPLGILPTDWWTNRSEIENGWAQSLRDAHLPPVVFRLLFRTAFLLSMLLLAEMFIGAGLAFFVNIAGAVGLTATTYWLPFVFYLKIYGREIEAWRFAWYLFNAVVGVFIAVVGVYYNTKDLVESDDFRLFTEESCKEGSYFWGDYMWDAHIPYNSTAYQTLVIGCCENGDQCGD